MKSLKVLAFAAMAAAMLLPSRAQQAVSFPGPELLGRPTDTSITVHVVANAAIDAYFQYGTEPGSYTAETAPVSSAANEPLAVTLDGLQSNTRYFYRMLYRQTGAPSWIAREEHTFQTQRARGSTFTFTVTADSHVNILFGNTSLYQRTLLNIADDRPDFSLDLGDTFPMDNVNNQAQANNAYLNQRPYFGLFGHSSSAFLVLGNHEEEERWHLDDTGNPATSKPVLGANARKRYFLNPKPDAFYSGNTDNTTSFVAGDHLLEDYYAWEWGDALFVAIDPFWYTATKPFIGNTGGGEASDAGSGDRWDWTLGADQYYWLKQTLENSTAAYKFIFAHHMTGGTDDYVRGGANGVPFAEWGGYNEDGATYAFDSRRPGWYAPVHQLLVENHVTAFFHAHDHEYAHEVRDGVIYELVPMAADSSYGFGSFQLYNERDPYTLRVLPNSGHLRVTVSPEKATVDYVRSFLPGDGNNEEVAYSYSVDGAAPNGTRPPVLDGVSAAPVPGGTATVEWTSDKPADSRVLYGLTPDLGLEASDAALVTSHNLTLTGLAPSTTYYYKVASTDADGNTSSAPEGPGAFLTPGPARVTAYPSGTVIQTGSFRRGGPESLTANDGDYFQINSTRSGTRTTSGYAVFTGVPGNLRGLQVAYRGRNSEECTQNIALWRWTTNTWVRLDSRVVGADEVLVQGIGPANPANFVSADGELRVRVLCSGESNFVASWEVLRISYRVP